VTGHAWIEVDLTAIRHNYERLCGLLGGAERVIPVVKGNAYGHGLKETARTLAAAGAPLLAVTFAEEAAAIREAGVECGILVMAPPRAEDARRAVELGAACCVMDEAGLRELSEAADAVGVTPDVHLKLDSGMGRLGVEPAAATALGRAITGSPRLRLAGVFSHCAQGHVRAAAERQLAAFNACVSSLEAAGVSVPLRHLAASSAALSCPEARLDAARVGNLLYGQFPTAELRAAGQAAGLELRDTWRFLSRVIAVRDFPAGAAIGYGAEFRTARPSRIAVVPVGTADGLATTPDSLTRGLRGLARVLLPGRNPLTVTVRERQAPVVGRVAMQLCSIDVTGIPGVEIGDPVRLPVRRLAADSSLPRVYR
jgi:alanine racemase